MAIVLNPIFKPIFTTKKRYIILTGGRGSSKSFGFNTAAALMSYEAGHKVLHTRVAMNTAEDSIIPEFREKLDLLEVASDFKVYKDEITNMTSGSKFLFRGIKTSSGDQTAKLKSIPALTDWFLDEAEELLDEKKFDDIDFSVRGSKVHNRIVLILNPTTKEHWIWKRWFAKHLRYVEIDGFQIPVSDHPDVLHIHTTYLDNPHLPAQFVEQMRKLKETDPEKYRHLVLGGWIERPDGLVFKHWEEGTFNTYLPYIHALDFGFSPDPLAMGKIAIDRRRREVYLKQKVYDTELSTKEVIAAVRNGIDSRNDLIMCDTSEGRLFAELKAAGLNVKMVSKKNTTRGGSVITDIRELHDWKIIIDPYSYDAKREFNSYVWDDKKSSTPKDADNHMCFAGETLIITDSGQKRIDEISIGDQALTSKGFMPILYQIDNGERDTIEYLIQFDTFSVSLESTPDHLVKTNLGWTKISQLQSGMTVYLPSDLMARHIGFTQKKDISQEAQSECTSLCGSITTEIENQVITSTTRTGTHKTIESKILNPFVGESTYPNTPNSRLHQDLSIEVDFMRLALWLRQSGIRAKKAESGIQIMPKNRQSEQKTRRFKRIAIIAEPTLEQRPFASQIQDSVQTHANQLTDVSMDMTISKESAIRAASLLAQTNTVQSGLVVERVEILRHSRKRVYDLMVYECHEYFANGILVSNCDVLRYGWRRLVGYPNLKGVRQIN